MDKEKILIFGDSYSTFKGYIPQDFAAYYPNEQCGVIEVSQTWWFLLVEEVRANIVMNNSWSGSTVCNTGYNGDCSKTSSFIHRLEVLIQDGFFKKNKIDKVLVFGGTNDSWTGNACGELQFSNWKNEDLRLVLPGYAYFIHKLLQVVSKEKIFVIVNNELRKEIEQGIVDICSYYEVACTVLSSVEKIEGHPTALGMQAIKNQVLKEIGILNEKIKETI